MAKLHLSLACGDYLLTQPLLDGTVRPEGIDLTCFPLFPEEMFFRMAVHQEFDVSEMSMSTFLLARERGEPLVVGIPVFPNRTFRHGYIFVNVHAGIDRPQDLTGKRVGIGEYQLTACLWIRGILQDEYGVRPESIQWYVERPEKVQVHVAGIRIEQMPPGENMSTMLEKGAVDGVLGPIIPECFLQGSPNVRRLIPHYHEVEMDYFQRNGIFPIMHTLVIRREIVESHPWAPNSVFKAFSEAKEIAFERVQAGVELWAPFLRGEGLDAALGVLGRDYWPYGVERNRKVLETVARYSHEQGLTTARAEVDSLFAPSTVHQWDDYKRVVSSM